jgi:hypothetical protein
MGSSASSKHCSENWRGLGKGIGVAIICNRFSWREHAKGNREIWGLE